MQAKIDPRKLIEELSVEELCRSAEEFYQNQTDPEHHMTRPFGNTFDAPHLLHRMGLVLHGLKLGKSMVVMDFGAGTCWFSRFLNQMQCATISVDASKSALELGRRSFERWPIIGEYVLPPRFLPFDGRRIDVEDESVDRIVCFDAFHHVPNQHQVLSEFHRVLKPGGIVGFSEPGFLHSQSDLSQQEMRNHTVLENDIRLDEIWDIAAGLGFTDVRVMLLSDPNRLLSFSDYRTIIDSSNEQVRPEQSGLLQRLLEAIRGRTTATAPVSPWPRVFTSVADAMRDSTVFFLNKGETVIDSRGHIGLAHDLKILSSPGTAVAQEPVEIEIQVENVGEAVWLNDNLAGIGVVKPAIHLLDSDRRLIDNDFARGAFTSTIAPGQVTQSRIGFSFPEPGVFELAVDLVSESVTWFEPLGSRPRYLRIEVTS